MISIDIHKKLQSGSGAFELELNFNIKKGDCITIYGNSGAGKTSTFRILAGLAQPDYGRIEVGGHAWFDSKQAVNLSPKHRSIGFVFQDYALFPNMTVLENLLFALRKGEERKVVDDLIEIVELGDLKHRKPNTLSGGQKQRVALARAVVQQPNILLLDEPLAAVDNVLRLKLQDYILRVHREYNLTTLLISHDVGEVVKLSNQVVVLDKGKIVKQGPPIEIFTQAKASKKISLIGDIIRINELSEDYEVTVLINQQLVDVIVQTEQIAGLSVGDKVMVATDMHHSTVMKVN